MADYLIEHGAWYEAADNEDNTPLFDAVNLGHADCLSVLMSKEADYSKINANGHNVLQIAVSFNHVDVASVLLEYGMDVNVIDPSNKTYLLIIISSKLNLYSFI